jgi:hypothetical protein
MDDRISQTRRSAVLRPRRELRTPTGLTNPTASSRPVGVLLLIQTPSGASHTDESYKPDGVFQTRRSLNPAADPVGWGELN